jgi:lipopolysaccharide transport system permease protein
LFLGAYLFVWIVIVGVRYPGAGRLDYVVFLFGGLVPFLFLMETLTSSAAVIRQNLQLVKSVIMPVDLIVTRTVLVGLVGHLVGVGLLVALSIASGHFTWRLALLPLIITIQVLWLTGLAWIVAPLGLMIPDVAQLVSLASILLMFISPIAFNPEMVPSRFRVVLQLNPITYMAGAYRWTVLRPPAANASDVFVLGMCAAVTAAIGGVFCWRFKGFAVDFE